MNTLLEYILMAGELSINYKYLYIEIWKGNSVGVK